MMSPSIGYTSDESFAAKAVHDLPVFSHSLDEPIKQLRGDNTAPPLQRSVASAAIAGGETVQREMVTGNQLILSTPYRTFFGTVYYRTQVIQKQFAVDDETAEQRETKKTIVFYPASWFRRLGMRYGFNAMASYRHGSWQYGLRPVHAVPDNSLILRFCETGNVDAVREMFISGQASIYDTNSRGWSLLHVSLWRCFDAKLGTFTDIHIS
jgi:hypothetical protein